MLRFGVTTKPFEARLDAASAEQKKQRLETFFREREDERLARSFDDLLDGLDEEELMAPAAGESAGGRQPPHALAKSHTVGDLRLGRGPPPPPPASSARSSFARRQHAWESSIGTSMALGLGSYAPPPPPKPAANENGQNPAGKSKAGNSKRDGFELDIAPQGQGTKEVMLFWVQCRLRDYKTVKVENFSTSWSDGIAFCALIHHFFPDAFDFSKLDPRNRRYNFDLAFRTADERAGIFPLLEPDDMVAMEKPDWKSVFAYIQSIYSVLK
ncbi:smoothelin-like protein 2 isoform X2 [Pollicipes pollicipes]|uniref:smoothelin-like protein 2 isoform X2 n=2 Tax=Pollicipes pollicipes TaxID=41117 RepID=UPI001884B2CB|nr:smoothelin-like protein 2 isoform X2 [Pollicipes pollicipes]